MKPNPEFWWLVLQTLPKFCQQDMNMSSDSTLKAEANALQYLQIASSSTRESVKNAATGLATTHPSGYPIQLMEDVLELHYGRQEEILSKILLNSPSKDDMVSFFRSEYSTLRMEMNATYNNAKQRALQSILEKTTSILHNSFSKEKYYRDPGDYFDTFASMVEMNVMREYAAGWLLPTSTVTSDPDKIAQLVQDETFRVSLRDTIHNAINNLREKHLDGFHKQNINIHLNEAMRSMEAALEVTVQEMVHTRPAGYLMVQLEQSLNFEYHRLKQTLHAQLKQSSYVKTTLDQFDADCVVLRTRMIDRYNAAKETALCLALNQANYTTKAYLKKLDVNDLWRGEALEHCENKLDTSLQQLARDVEGSVLQKCATGWLLTAQGTPLNTSDPEVEAQATREKTFLAELHGAIQRPVAAFTTQWQEELKRRIAQAEAEEEAAELKAERLRQCAEGTNKQDERVYESESYVRAGKSSTCDQHRRAAEWAAKNLKLPDQKKTAKKKPAVKLVKSVEQQRADALAYAKKLYGEDIGLASPVLKNRTYEEEKLEGEEAAFVSANIKPPSSLLMVPPVFPTVTVNPVKSARTEAHRLAKEMAEAAASAVAERAAKMAIKRATKKHNSEDVGSKCRDKLNRKPSAVETDRDHMGAKRADAAQLMREYEYETELKAHVTQLLDSFEPKTGELFLTRFEALGRFGSTEKAVQGKFQTRLSDIVSNVAAASGTPVAIILDEYAAQLQDIHSSSEAQFLALYSQQFNQWLLKARKAAEKTIEHEALLIEKSLPLEDHQLTQQLESAYRLGLNFIGGTKKYGAACTEAADAEQLLRRFFEFLSASVQERNARLNQTRRREADDRLQDAMRSMEAALEVTVQEMARTRPAGYLMVQLEQTLTLNQEYHTRKNTLQAQLKQSPYAAATLDQFDADYVSLCGRMKLEYDAAKEAAFAKALAEVNDSTELYLHTLRPEDNHALRLEANVRIIQQGIVDCYLAGWLLTARKETRQGTIDSTDEMKREHLFLDKLREAVYTATKALCPTNQPSQRSRWRLNQVEKRKKKGARACFNPVFGLELNAQICFREAPTIPNAKTTNATRRGSKYENTTERSYVGAKNAEFNSKTQVNGADSAAPRRRKVTCRHLKNPTKVGAASPGPLKTSGESSVPQFTNPEESRPVCGSEASVQQAGQTSIATERTSLSENSAGLIHGIKANDVPPIASRTRQVLRRRAKKPVKLESTPLNTSKTIAKSTVPQHPQYHFPQEIFPCSSTAETSVPQPRQTPFVASTWYKGPYTATLNDSPETARPVSVDAKSQNESELCKKFSFSRSLSTFLRSLEEEPELGDFDIFPEKYNFEHCPTQQTTPHSSPKLSLIDEDFAALCTVSEAFAVAFRTAVQSRESSPQRSYNGLDACLARSGALHGVYLSDLLLDPSEAAVAEEMEERIDEVEEVMEIDGAIGVPAVKDYDDISSERIGAAYIYVDQPDRRTNSAADMYDVGGLQERLEEQEIVAVTLPENSCAEGTAFEVTNSAGEMYIVENVQPETCISEQESESIVTMLLPRAFSCDARLASTPSSDQSTHFHTTRADTSILLPTLPPSYPLLNIELCKSMENISTTEVSTDMTTTTEKECTNSTTRTVDVSALIDVFVGSNSVGDESNNSKDCTTAASEGDNTEEQSVIQCCFEGQTDTHKEVRPTAEIQQRVTDPVNISVQEQKQQEEQKHQMVHRGERPRTCDAATNTEPDNPAIDNSEDQSKDYAELATAVVPAVAAVAAVADVNKEDMNSESARQERPERSSLWKFARRVFGSGNKNKK